MNELKALLGSGNYLESESDKEPYLTGWRGGWKGNAPLVALPKSTEQVAALVKYCATHRIPIVPQGGNTGLVGGSVPDSSNSAIVLSLSRMNRIRDVNAENFSMIAEAGCIIAKLHEAAAEKQRLFPLSFAAEGSATIGGAISTNAGGINVLKYGMTRDLVLGIEAVLPNGDILHGLRALRKDNTGYDLKQLLIGAEGTLGIVTAACVKLFPAHRSRETLWLAVPDAVATVNLFSLARDMLDETIIAFELVSDDALSVVLAQINGTRRPVEAPSPWHILLECANTERTMLENFLVRAFESGLVTDGALSQSLTQRQEFWNIREHISEAVRKAGKGVHFDIALPIAAVPEFLEKANHACEQAVPEAKRITFGHLGDGNLHYNFYLPETSFAERKAKLKEIVYRELLSLGGSISAEHGIGQERTADLPLYKSPEELALMRQIKATLDPFNLMNPGKIL